MAPVLHRHGTTHLLDTPAEREQYRRVALREPLLPLALAVTLLALLRGVEYLRSEFALTWARMIFMMIMRSHWMLAIMASIAPHLAVVDSIGLPLAVVRAQLYFAPLLPLSLQGILTRPQPFAPSTSMVMA